MWFTQICLGVHRIHQKQYTHRNLKPENILFSGKTSMIVKIINLKFAYKFDKKQSVQDLEDIGTLDYMSKE